MSDTDRPTPEVGDEINYRSMEGCTVATVEEVRDGTVVLDNGIVVPDHCILEVLNREVYTETDVPGVTDS